MMGGMAPLRHPGAKMLVGRKGGDLVFPTG